MKQEDAEKEVREKLGWWIEDDMLTAIGLQREGSLPEVEAYNLCVSLTRELAEARELLQDVCYERGCEPGSDAEEDKLMLCPVCQKAMKLLSRDR